MTITIISYCLLAPTLLRTPVPIENNLRQSKCVYLKMANNDLSTTTTTHTKKNMTKSHSKKKVKRILFSIRISFFVCLISTHFPTTPTTKEKKRKAHTNFVEFSLVSNRFDIDIASEKKLFFSGSLQNEITSNWH